MTTTPIILDANALPLADVAAVARDGVPVRLGERGRAKIQAARTFVEATAQGTVPVYGINTGFGSLSRKQIGHADLRDLQRNLIRSHAAGVGQELPEEVVRATALLLAASLSRGHSGVRPIVVETLLAMLNEGVTPCVPSRGSVGASGDLAPLAHLALVLIGEGEAVVGYRRLSGADALAVKGIEPIVLEAKEGLALINGTHLMGALASLALVDTERVIEAAVVATAMAIDACRASAGPMDDRLHVARRHDGPRRVARRVRLLLEGSGIIKAHAVNDPRVQDPYGLRAAPVVLGAALESITNIRSVVETELGAVTDNPLVFADDEAILSGANFHGMPLAIALDTLKIAIAHVAGISERRVYWLLKASDEQNPVSAYLSPDPGLHSGLMIVQYTAAACCNEIQTLAYPSSVGNIPTAAGIEDYNSMGATSGHHARMAVDLARNVIAIELLTMTEAIDWHRPLRSGAKIEDVHAVIRTVVPKLVADRSPSPDIRAITKLITSGAITRAAGMS